VAPTTGRQRAGEADGRALGVLAGAGPLPIQLAEAGARQGRRVHIVAIDGFAGEEVARFPHEHVSIGQLGRMIGSFRRAGVTDLVIAGALQRPNLLSLRVDWGFVRNLPTVLELTRGGDDSVLRRVIRFFEGHGFTVLGASDIAPDLLPPQSLMTGTAPEQEHDLALGRAVALMVALGPFDIGQGIVATPDGIAAVEGVKGTDAMLRDLGPGGVLEGRGRGGVLVKLAKPGQEMRIDLPTIGPETVRGAVAAGLAGIAVGAGATIMLERANVVASADAAGLFVQGIAQPAGAASPGRDGTRHAAPLMEIVARRAPTPDDRRDIQIGRQVLDVLRRHGGGHAALISREHVLAVSGPLDLPTFVAAQGRIRTWGPRALGKRRGVVVIDAAALGPAAGILDVALFSAAKAAAIAGLVVLAPLAGGEARADIVAWANEAGVFLMCEPGGP
jgi:DUF1009 family protein